MAVAEGLAIGFDTDNSALLNVVFALGNQSKRSLDTARTNVCKKPKTTSIYTNDGNLLISDMVGNSQKSTITTHRNGKISIKIIRRKSGKIGNSNQILTEKIFSIVRLNGKRSTYSTQNINDAMKF